MFSIQRNQIIDTQCKCLGKHLCITRISHNRQSLFQHLCTCFDAYLNTSLSQQQSQIRLSLRRFAQQYSFNLP